jgi:hypothetical protein
MNALVQAPTLAAYGAVGEIRQRLAGLAVDIDWHREQLTYYPEPPCPFLKDHTDSIARLERLQAEYTDIIDRLETT